MATTQTTIPFLGQPIEICIVTGNLKETLSGLGSLGIGPFKIFHFRPGNATEQTFRGQPGNFSFDVAFSQQEGPIWEVMQPISGESLMQEFLDETGGNRGIQHVACDCLEGGKAEPRLASQDAREEAQRRRAKFEARGFPLAQSGLWHGKKGTCEFMCFDTAGAVNTCFGTYIFSEDWEDPEEGVKWFHAHQQ